jgi:NAD-specific glutamate dehydrogenase
MPRSSAGSDIVVNIVAGAVVAPPSRYAWTELVPYLVVAADKGTAS